MDGIRKGNKKTHTPKCYATGGRVPEDISEGALPMMDDPGSFDYGMEAEGGLAATRMDRPAKKSAPVNVNIIVNSGKSQQPDAPPMPPPLPPMAGPPGPMPPPPGPPMGGIGGGGPPGMPMRKYGGRVEAGGAGGGLGRLAKSKAYASGGRVEDGGMPDPITAGKEMYGAGKRIYRSIKALGMEGDERKKEYESIDKDREEQRQRTIKRGLKAP